MSEDTEVAVDPPPIPGQDPPMTFRVRVRRIVSGLNATLLLVVCGCASGQQTYGLAGITPELEREESAPKVEGDKPPAPPETVVENAGLPFRGFRAADKEELTDDELVTYLAAADAVCIGENHDNVLHHYAQLAIVRGFIERRPMRGFELGLGLEMVRREKQLLLDAYAANRVAESEFETQSNWRSEWGFPIQYYRPQLQAARQDSATLLGLGVHRELTKRIASVGRAGLSDEERSHVPELDKSSTEHRELFEAMMSGHPHRKEGSTTATLETYYEAQLAWDEMMATRAQGWLTAKYPLRKLIILAGAAHCHRSAIPARMERGSDLRVVSLMPVNSSPVDAESEEGLEGLLAAGYDFQMVFQK